MKNIIRSVAVAASIILCGCNSSTVDISGRFLGLNGRSVCLEKVSGGGGAVVDSVSLGEDGSYRFRIAEVSKTPTLYNIVYNGERIPLLVRGGERVTVNSVGTLLRNYTVAGSEESELLREFNKVYIDGLERMNTILEGFSGAEPTAEVKNSMMKEYMTAYRATKRAQLQFIIEHKDRIAAVYALYQRFPGENHLFSDDGDIIYYRTVADAVEGRYPESPFLPTLRSEIATMDARKVLMSSIAETAYPDIKLPDMYGNEVRLSSLEGKTILLSFWSVGAADANVLNAELKALHEKYSDRGFEVYQVCVGTPKALWINAVQEQQLPWVSVCDLKGDRSVLGLYNVTRLPADFLIDAEGNLVGRDLYGAELERKLTEILR